MTKTKSKVESRKTLSERAATTIEESQKKIDFKEMEKRLAKCENGTDSNCVGTALYIIGQIKEDKYKDTTTVYETYLSYLNVLDKPSKGTIIAWHMSVDGKIETKHMGIVVSTEPVIVASRLGNQGIFDPKLSLETLEEHYAPITALQHVFYEPKIMLGIKISGKKPNLTNYRNPWITFG
jgi:hypothetical protein